MKRADAIRQYLLAKIPNNPTNIVNLASEHFSVTRTTIHRHLNYLLDQGKIAKYGTTSQIEYKVLSNLNKKVSAPIDSSLDEHALYMTHIDKAVGDENQNVQDILSYGFTEIVNNAIDHSQGDTLSIYLCWQDEAITISIEDNGIGIYKKLMDGFQLDDLRESVLQLNKGKMTTDPKHHTGEGVFFSSRAFDTYDIYANNLHYHRDNNENDWFLEGTDYPIGTRVEMNINRHSKTDLIDLFKTFQHPETLAFDRTQIQVALSRFGEERFISRSQAKRITRNLENFAHVILDFSNVNTVGQGFVDEVFRVFQNRNPQMKITYINANDDIEFMIKRGLVERSRIPDNDQ